jgi:hypothetical protein
MYIEINIFFYEFILSLLAIWIRFEPVFWLVSVIVPSPQVAACGARICPSVPVYVSHTYFFASAFRALAIWCSGHSKRPPLWNKTSIF